VRGEQVKPTGETDYIVACDCAGLLIQTNAHEDTCPVEQERWSDPEYVAAWEAANPCAHDWLDRPESDTRECLICGLEVTGC